MDAEIDKWYVTGKGVRRNREKALETLIGICTGLLADQNLNEREVLFLNVWLRDNSSLHNDPDVVDIICLLDNIIKNGIADANEIADLRCLIRDILTYRKDTRKDKRVVETNKLLGIIQGIMADQILHDSEIFALLSWLEDHNKSATEWPGSILSERIRRVLADNVITSAERDELSQFLNQTGACDITLAGSAANGVMLLGVDEVPGLTLQNHTFCLTGTFAFGTRSFCEHTTKDKGGIISKGVTKQTDYLVLGTSPSKHWIHSSYGRKIESAIGLQNTGHRIKIITEFDWTIAL